VKENHIDWHKAFAAALKAAFKPYRDVLEFQEEVQLNTQPLRIDVVIIKKKPEAVINSRLAAVFKTANILEYKSPGDYLSVDSFNRTLAYCFLYASVERMSIGELSLSIIVGRNPVKTLKYIKETCKWTVEERRPGMHIVEGAPFQIQVIESGKVEEREGLWLKELHGKHGGESLGKVLEESLEHLNEEYMKVYLYILLEANPQGAEEVKKMGRETLDEVLERMGMTETWAAQGRAEEVDEALVMLEMLRKGKPLDEIEKIYKEKRRRLMAAMSGG
jgi:hypothetical protein